MSKNTFLRNTGDAQPTCRCEEKDNMYKVRSANQDLEPSPCYHLYVKNIAHILLEIEGMAKRINYSYAIILCNPGILERNDNFSALLSLLSTSKHLEALCLDDCELPEDQDAWN